MERKTLYISLAALVAFAILAAFAFQHLRKDRATEVSVVPLNDNGMASTSPDGSSTVTIQEGKKLEVPALDREIPATSPAGLDPAGRQSAIVFLNNAIEAVRKNNASYGDWLEVGLGRQVLGDFEGAKIAWEYAIYLAPQEPVAYANLGYLNMMYLKNYPLSESYFKKAITLNTKDPNAYRTFFELYAYHYKQGTSAGENLLKEGIQNNPQASDLRVLLARYYRDQGRVSDAKTAYEGAAVAAEQSGRPDIAKIIREEASALK